MKRIKIPTLYDQKVDFMEMYHKAVMEYKKRRK